MTRSDLIQAIDDVLDEDQLYLTIAEIRDRIRDNTGHNADEGDIRSILDEDPDDYIYDDSKDKWTRNTEDRS
ncbi:MAG: hypothetical protein ABSG90_00270 [Dehalococcoidia bacterium]|jgi:hypothetical protein